MDRILNLKDEAFYKNLQNKSKHDFQCKDREQSLVFIVIIFHYQTNTLCEEISVPDGSIKACYATVLFRKSLLDWSDSNTHRSYLSNETLSFFMEKQTNRKVGSFKGESLKRSGHL